MQKNGGDARYNKMLAIWSAMFLSQFFLSAFVFFTRPGLFTFDLSASFWGNSVGQMIGFAVVGVAVVLFSFAFRRRFNERATETRDPKLIESGLIVAVALCEACSLIGVGLAFAFEYPYFYLWLLLAAFAMLLHFPLRPKASAAAQTSGTNAK